MKSTTQIHPAEVGTSALILAALFGLVSCLAGRSQTIETEDFKGFHVPAKHTIDAGTFVLYDGVVINGKPVRMNPHMVFVAMDYWDAGSFDLLGEEPPAMHSQSIVCVGGHPKIWIYLDHPAKAISFDVRGGANVFELAIGFLSDYPLPNSPWPAISTDAFTHLRFDVGAPIYEVDMYGVGYGYGPIAISNIEIEY